METPQAEKDRAEFDVEWKELGKLIAQDRKLRETLRQKQLDRNRDMRCVCVCAGAFFFVHFLPVVGGSSGSLKTLDTTVAYLGGMCCAPTETNVSKRARNKLKTDYLAL